MEAEVIGATQDEQAVLGELMHDPIVERPSPYCIAWTPFTNVCRPDVQVCAALRVIGAGVCE